MGSNLNAWTAEDEERAKIENRGLSMKDYLRGCQLGPGGWSIVYKIRRVSDGKLFAGKSFKSSNFLKKEADVLQRLRHNHIVKFVKLYQESTDEASTLLITELCPYGTVQTRIDRATPHMKPNEVVRTALQIAQALRYLHAQSLYHSDVKPRNILIRALHPIDVVLGDCADVKTVGEVCKLQGTPAYWSPEMMARKGHYGPADDVWALGVTVLGMVGQWPRMRYTRGELEGYPRRCFEHVCRLGELNPGLGIVRLMGGMMAWEGERRVTAEECVVELRGMDVDMEGDGRGFEIQSPEEFRPMSFW